MRSPHWAGPHVAFLVGMLSAGVACDARLTRPEGTPSTLGTYVQITQEGFSTPVRLRSHGAPRAGSCRFFTDSARISIDSAWIDIKWNGLLLCSDTASVISVRQAEVDRRFAITAWGEQGFIVWRGDSVPGFPTDPVGCTGFCWPGVTSERTRGALRSAGDDGYQHEMAVESGVAARRVGDSLLLGGDNGPFEVVLAWGLESDVSRDPSPTNHPTPASLSPPNSYGNDVWQPSRYRRISP